MSISRVLRRYNVTILCGVGFIGVSRFCNNLIFGLVCGGFVVCFVLLH